MKNHERGRDLRVKTRDLPKKKKKITEKPGKTRVLPDFYPVNKN